MNTEMKFALDEGAFAPTSAHEDDAAYDIRTPIDCSIFPGRAITIDTRLHLQIPKGCGGLLVAKSGLNVRDDITNTGLIDPGYTGTLRVKLYNLGSRTKAFRTGDKVAQIMIVPVLKPTLVQVELSDFEVSERGEGGFGSTGR